MVVIKDLAISTIHLERHNHTIRMVNNHTRKVVVVRSQVAEVQEDLVTVSHTIKVVVVISRLIISQEAAHNPTIRAITNLVVRGNLSASGAENLVTCDVIAQMRQLQDQWT